MGVFAHDAHHNPINITNEKVKVEEWFVFCFIAVKQLSKEFQIPCSQKYKNNDCVFNLFRLPSPT